MNCTKIIARVIGRIRAIGRCPAIEDLCAQLLKDCTALAPSVENQRVQGLPASIKDCVLWH